MKSLAGTLLFILLLIIAGGCMGKGAGKKGSGAEADTVSVPDTGFTGIKQYMSSGRLLKEVTFKNGVREGLTKTYYFGGQLYQTFWYENGLRQDSGRWYYETGQLFRSTPYKNDTIDGIQKQFYMSGELRAKIGFKKGLRTTLLEEYAKSGRRVTGYPDIVVNIRDEYKTAGRYRINMARSDTSTRVEFYRGEFINGCFDTTRCTPIKTVNGVGTLILKKSKTEGAGYVGIIGAMITSFGNRYLTAKRIDLPYKDLN